MVTINQLDKNIMKITYILLISFFLIFSCKQVKNKDSTILLKSSNENIDKNGINKKESTQIESNCFTKDDLQKVDILLKSIVKNDKNSMSNFVFSFKRDDLQKIKSELMNKSFNYYELIKNNIECDSSLFLKIFHLDEFKDGDDVHYSERSEMYSILRVNNILILKFETTAG